MQLKHSLSIFFAILIGATQGTTAEQHPGNRLPKIRVAPDGRTFETDDGKPFVPFGLNYYRPGTGWAPKIWLMFDAEATRRDFARMKELGVNCVRVFLTYRSFYSDPGKLNPDGIAKFDQFIAMAEQAGIYVHPTGPEHWEGHPNWQPCTIADERTLEYTEQFWKLFAARYRDRHVIFAYDLKNEPHIEWNNNVVLRRWHDWLQKKYGTIAKLNQAWKSQFAAFENLSIPSPDDAPKPRLLEYQAFREDVADEWTRRQVAAIKSVAPDALATVGFLQTSVPTRVWHNVEDYTGYRPLRQAKYLDFMEFHFYPSERGGYEYRTEDDELANLSYLEGIAREVARTGKPVVMAEFGWYGGKEKPKFDHGAHPIGTEEQQAKYLKNVIETSSGFVVGWLNWGFYDHPGATDCSELTGLLTASGETKAWGKTFQQLSAKYSGKKIPARPIGPRPTFNWDAAITNIQAQRDFRKEYFKDFLADRKANQPKDSKTALQNAR